MPRTKTHMLTITCELAMAIGQDAGNAAMRRAGGKVWNADDWNIAAATTHALLAGKDLDDLVVSV